MAAEELTEPLWIEMATQPGSGHVGQDSFRQSYSEGKMKLKTKAQATKDRKRAIKRKQTHKRKPMVIKPEPEDDFITADWLQKIGFKDPTKYGAVSLTVREGYRMLQLFDGSKLLYKLHSEHKHFGAVGVGWVGHYGASGDGAPGRFGRFRWLECGAGIFLRSDLLFLIEGVQERIKKGVPVTYG
jgi:hypothetical protein